MPRQPGRICHTTRPNWVAPTLLVMKIIPSLGSPDLGYLQGQNDRKLRAQVRPRSGRAKGHALATKRLENKNRSKRIITSIRLCQEKKTYSHTQRHTPTQCRKSDDPSKGCDNTTNEQSHLRSKIAGEIIIKEGRTQKVS